MGPRDSGPPCTKSGVLDPWALGDTRSTGSPQNGQERQPRDNGRNLRPALHRPALLSRPEQRKAKQGTKRKPLAQLPAFPTLAWGPSSASWCLGRKKKKILVSAPVFASGSQASHPSGKLQGTWASVTLPSFLGAPRSLTPEATAPGLLFPRLPPTAPQPPGQVPPCPGTSSAAAPGTALSSQRPQMAPSRGARSRPTDGPEPRPMERGGPETVTSFTVPESSPSFFFITSLVRTVSDSMVFYGRDVVCYTAAVILQARVQRSIFLSSPLPCQPAHPGAPHCTTARPAGSAAEG